MKIVITRGTQRFEIKRVPGENASGYVGYVNGAHSVTATSADIAARALIKKHIVGLPEAKVLRFPLEQFRAQRSGISTVPRPDLAG